MKKLMLSLLVISTFSLFAQTAKREILLDETNKVITEEEFKKQTAPPDYKYTYTITKNEHSVIKKLILRKELGTIKEIDRLRVISELEAISGRKVDPSQTIIINFFHEGNSENRTRTVHHYSTDGKYKRFIGRSPHIAQFFITEKGFSYNKKNIVNDKNEQIEKLLFPVPFYSNYIIIKPNGHYYKQVSEYRQDDIPKILEEEWKITNP